MLTYFKAVLLTNESEYRASDASNAVKLFPEATMEAAIKQCIDDGVIVTKQSRSGRRVLSDEREFDLCLRFVYDFFQATNVTA
jgi:hypothetical protein